MLQHSNQLAIVHYSTRKVNYRYRVGSADRPAWIISIGLSNFNSSPCRQVDLKPKRKNKKPVQRGGFVKLSTNIELAKEHSFAINELIGVLRFIQELQKKPEPIRWGNKAFSKESGHTGLSQRTVKKNLPVLEGLEFVKRVGRTEKGVILRELNCEKLDEFYGGRPKECQFYPLPRQLFHLNPSQRHVMALLFKRWSDGFYIATDTNRQISDGLCMKNRTIQLAIKELESFVRVVSDQDKKDAINSLQERVKVEAIELDILRDGLDPDSDLFEDTFQHLASKEHDHKINSEILSQVQRTENRRWLFATDKSTKLLQSLFKSYN